MDLHRESTLTNAMHRLEARGLFGGADYLSECKSVLMNTGDRCCGGTQLFSIQTLNDQSRSHRSGPRQ